MNRSALANLLNSVINTILILVAFVTPLLFLPFTTEFFEAPKLIFLSIAVGLMLILWVLSWVVQGKVLITRTPLDIPFLLLLVVMIVSTFFSEVKFVSILGNFPRLHGSVVSWVLYILLYFAAVSNIKDDRQVRNLLYALLSSALAVSIVSVLSYFNYYLPLAFTKSPNFTPTGNSASTTALLVLLLPITIISIIRPNKFLPSSIGIVLALVFGLTIGLLGSLTIQLGAILALVLGLLVYKPDLKTTLPALLIPVVVTILAVAVSFMPMGNRPNPLMDKRVNYPREIQLPFSTSWKISASAFRDNPFIGTGPSTYLYNFTRYKPVEFNSTPYWTARFDSAFNEYLQILGTLGILGLLAFLLFSLNILNLAFSGFKQRSDILAVTLSISSILFILLLLVHTSSLVLIVAMLLLLAAFMHVNKYKSQKVEEFTIGIKAQKLTENFNTNTIVAGDILPLIIFALLIIWLFYSAWNGVNLVRADMLHRQALNAASTRGLDTYNSLVEAEKLAPLNDLYRIDLAQTNFALANSIAVSKAPNEASPGGYLTDQDKVNIRTLLSQAIQEGRAAVTLNPRNAANWEVLGSIYRNISGVAENALQFSLDSYGRAVANDPLNPLLRLSVGGVYYSVRNYDLAVRFFTDTVNLKPDYANGWYNLSVALRDKGDLQSAQAAAERVLSILQTNTESADYQTAAKYLEDLKSRIATGSAQSSQVTAPAAAGEGALQGDNLPNVLDLPEPDNIATPPAVKR